MEAKDKLKALLGCGKLTKRTREILEEIDKSSLLFGSFTMKQQALIERTFNSLFPPKKEYTEVVEPECPRCENVGLLEVHTEGVVVWGRCSCPIGVGKNWPLPIIQPDQFTTKPIDPTPWVPQDKNINPGSFINNKVEGWRERVNISKAFWRENLF